MEKHYGVSSGKWYFEFEVLTAGPMRVGWAKADCNPGTMLGNDENTWAFDGYNVSQLIVIFETFDLHKITRRTVEQKIIL